MITKTNTKTMTGSKAIIQTLKDFGVEKIFGYPGGIVLSLYDELYKQSDIQHILVRHEQSAVHAAEGYARSTGKCGVVLVTSGPGATNTVTGIVNAYLDGYPLIILTGQVDKNLISKEAFQEANICDITKSCCKKVFQVTKADDIQNTISEAFSIALSGKKGPVLIDLAKNIFNEKIEYSTKKFQENEIQAINFEDIDRIIYRINNAQKPIFVAGGGVTHSQAGDELKKLSDKFGGIPIVSTMMGLGNIPKESCNFFGMIGIFGDNSANQLIKESDLIVSFGARFNDRITCIFDDTDLEAKIIKIDINDKEISKTIKPLDYIVGDIKNILKLTNKSENYIFNNFSKWNKEAQNLKKLNKPNSKETNMLHSYEVISKIDEYTKDKNIIFTTEVGQHQIWAAKNLTLNNNRKILLSGGLGTMGFGLPAAIGAAIGNPDKTIICITGDGSFQMSIPELATCKEQNLDIKIIIMNNGYLGMVRQLQQKNYEGRYYETKIHNPNFIKLAQSYGINATKINSVNNIEKALEKSFSSRDTYIIDFGIEPMEVI